MTSPLPGSACRPNHSRVSGMPTSTRTPKAARLLSTLRHSSALSTWPRTSTERSTVSPRRDGSCWTSCCTPSSTTSTFTPPLSQAARLWATSPKSNRHDAGRQPEGSVSYVSGRSPRTAGSVGPCRRPRLGGAALTTALGPPSTVWRPGGGIRLPPRLNPEHYRTAKSFRDVIYVRSGRARRLSGGDYLQRTIPNYFQRRRSLYSMLAIRLQRFGRKKSPIYRVAVQEDDPSSGRVSVVAYVGTFNAHAKKANLNKEDLGFYLKNGAQPTPRVVRILNDEGIELPAWLKQSKEEPIAAVETNTEAPAAIAETPAEKPAATEESPADAPAATDETPTADEPPAADETPTQELAAPAVPPTYESAAAAETPEEPAADNETPTEAPAATDETPTGEPGADITHAACGRTGCTGAIVDGYCDVCGSPVDATSLVAAAAAASAAAPASQSRDVGGVTTCSQPGCTGTIVDGYCDVCGSPADATSLVAAGAAASGAAPASQSRDVGGVTTCSQPGCTGTIVDGYCDVCGSPADATSLVAAAAAASGAAPASQSRDVGGVTTCSQPGRTGAIVDGYCDVCGSPADATSLLAAAAASGAVPASQSRGVGGVTTCTQPGCTGTIVDGYCDVCGSPADATSLVAAGAAASAAPPAPAARPRRTAVRRLVGVAAVLFLLASAVAFYRIVPGFSASGPAPSMTVSSAPTAGAQSPGGLLSNAGPTPASNSPINPTSAATPGARATTGSGGAANAIQVEDFAGSAKPFQTVAIHGTYRGGSDTFVQVQHWQAGTWVPFPVPAKTDNSGRFTARVEIPQPGRHRLRVIDLDTGATSKPFVLVIKA